MAATSTAPQARPVSTAGISPQVIAGVIVVIAAVAFSFYLMRTNVVLSRVGDFRPEGVLVARDLDAALALVAGAPEVVVIGGAALYAEALPRAQRIYLTRVHARPEGDVYFPELDPADWRESLVLEHPADARHAFAFSIYELERRTR